MGRSELWFDGLACRTHLLGMGDDPFHREEFLRVLQYFRMDRYEAVA